MTKMADSGLLQELWAEQVRSNFVFFKCLLITSVQMRARIRLDDNWMVIDDESHHTVRVDVGDGELHTMNIGLSCKIGDLRCLETELRTLFLGGKL